MINTADSLIIITDLLIINTDLLIIYNKSDQHQSYRRELGLYAAYELFKDPF